MEPLATIIGIGILVFLLLFIAYNLESNNEITLKILKVFIVIFCIFFLILIPKVIVDSGTKCQLLLNHSEKFEFYIYGNQFNQTNETHWDQEQIDPSSFPNLGNNEYTIFHITTNTSNTYSEYCISTSNNTNSLVHKHYVFFVSTFMTLLFIYFTYIALKNIKIKWRK